MTGACVEYAWPPVLTAGKTETINVCAFTQRAGFVRLRLCSSAPLLDTASPSHVGHTTYRLNITPRPAGTLLQLSLTSDTAEPGGTRRPDVVPLLVLPAESVEEVNRLFDSLVRERLAHAASHAAGPSTPAGPPNERSTPAAAAATAAGVTQQNLVVGQVYRETVLPLLQDMQVILADAPYHVIRSACARMAPLLHAANMHCCLSVLRELVRTHNDIREDLLALQLRGLTVPVPAADNTRSWMAQDVTQLVLANTSNSNTHNSTSRATLHRATSNVSNATSSGSLAQHAGSAGQGRDSHRAHSQSQATNRSSRATRSTRSSAQQSSIYHSLPDCTTGSQSSPQLLPGVWDRYMLTADECQSRGERSSDPSPRSRCPSLADALHTHASRVAQPAGQPHPGRHGAHQGGGPYFGMAGTDLMRGGRFMLQRPHAPSPLFASSLGLHLAAGPACEPEPELELPLERVLARGPARDMPDSDEELDLLFTSLEEEAEAGSCSQQMVLTSFVPDHQDHMLDDPLQMLVDPDQPVSRSLSEVGTVIDSIVQASHDATGGHTQLVRVPSESSIGTQLSSQLHRLQPHSGDGHSQELPPLITTIPITVVPDPRAHQVPDAAAPAGVMQGSEQDSNSPVPSDTLHGAAAAENQRRVSLAVAAHPGLRSDSVSALPQPQACAVPVAPSGLLHALHRSWVGFEDRAHERRFRRFWSRHMRLMDVTTLCLTLLTMFCTLRDIGNPSVLPFTAEELRSAATPAGSSPAGAALPHGATLVLVALMAAPVLVGTYLVVVHQQAALKHREAITATTRLLTSCLWVVLMGLGLTSQVPAMQLVANSRVWRFALGQLKNACRPVLLRHVLVCCLLEAFCLAALAHHHQPSHWLWELTCLWAASIATTAAIDITCRRAYIATQHARAAPPSASAVLAAGLSVPGPALACAPGGNSSTSSDRSSTGNPNSASTSASEQPCLVS